MYVVDQYMLHLLQDLANKVGVCQAQGALSVLEKMTVLRGSEVGLLGATDQCCCLSPQWG